MKLLLNVWNRHQNIWKNLLQNLTILLRIQLLLNWYISLTEAQLTTLVTRFVQEKFLDSIVREDETLFAAPAASQSSAQGSHLNQFVISKK